MPENTQDTVAVVRCRDCIHWDKKYAYRPYTEPGMPQEEIIAGCLKIFNDGQRNDIYAWQHRKESDFCSYGVRRTLTAEGGQSHV